VEDVHLATDLVDLVDVVSRPLQLGLDERAADLDRGAGGAGAKLVGALLESAQAQVSYAEIRSPLNGVITDRPLYPGEMTSTGAPMITVMDMSKVVARS